MMLDSCRLGMLRILNHTAFAKTVGSHAERRAAQMGEFDHHSSGFAAGWRGQYRDIRATCPVMRVDAQGGVVLLTRYEDIKPVLLAPKEFASGRDLELDGVPGTVTGGVTVPANPFRMGMMEMDAPESLRLLNILLPWFSARA